MQLGLVVLPGYRQGGAGRSQVGGAKVVEMALLCICCPTFRFTEWKGCQGSINGLGWDIL